MVCWFLISQDTFHDTDSLLPGAQERPPSRGSAEHTRLKNWKNSNIHPLEAFNFLYLCPPMTANTNTTESHS